jgi:hypothetical protein
LYNELVSAAIDQERMMKAVGEVNEKKRKNMMPRSAGSGSSSGVHPTYRMVYTPPGGAATSTTIAAELGQSLTIPTVAILAATAATTVAATTQPCSYPITTAISCQQLSMLQLWEDVPLCSRMPPAQAKQLTVSSGTHGQPAEGHQKGPTPRTGRTNYTIVEEILTGEEVLAGTFFLNEHPIIILFDPGALHDFMSFTCAKKAKLSLVASGAPYMSSTPGGRVDA